MQTLVSLLGLYLLHRLLLHFVPAYRVRFREFDRKIVWINTILVGYLLLNFFIYLIRYLNQGE
jgi:hypothetical protein